VEDDQSRIICSTEYKMKTLYVASTESFSGKSAICVGLGERFRADGQSLGYLKPVSASARKVGEQLVDEDAQFLRQLWGLSEPLDTLVPIMLTSALIAGVMTGNVTDLPGRIDQAFAQVSQGKDVVVVEAGGNLAKGAVAQVSAPEVIGRLGGQALVVTRFADDAVADNLVLAQRILGPAMLGGVINSVPRQRLDFVTGTVVPFLAGCGVKVYAVLPRERVLQAVTVGELAEGLSGNILNCPEHADDLVENLMVGAMGVDNALSYFRLKANKAIITGGDRSDIQLAALETSTRCLILTGNFQPNPIIVARAEELGVPMILTTHDTLTAVEMVEGFFGKTRFHQEQKVLSFKKLFNERFDFDALYSDW
jgi:BioD-like phosphotransacetylase family protein